MTLSLVTGGAGFVGRHLVDALNARSEAVRVFDLAPCNAAQSIVGSITNAADAANAVRGVDTVFHLAGNAQLWARDKSDFDAVNHQGTRVMLEAARAAGVRRFIHCSSLTTLVGAGSRIGASEADESTRLAAGDMLGAYPRSKLLAERAVEQSDLDAVIAIPTEPLGPGDENLTPPTQLILDLLAGKTPATIDCMLNFVDVRSLAEGLITARDRGRRGERYILGGENVSMRRLLDTLGEMTDKKMPSTQLPYAVALLAGVIDSEIVSRITGIAPRAPLTGVRLAGRRVSFSSAKAETELGWKSAPFEMALKSALDWFAAKGMI